MLAFGGDLAFLDAVVFTSICEGARNLSRILARDFPDLHVTYLQLPDGQASSEAVDHWEAELRRLGKGISEKFGVAVEDSALRASLGLYNLWRRRVRELYAQRTQWPHRISAEELCCLIRAGTRMPPEAHIPLLDEVLREIPFRGRRRRGRLPVVVEGAVCEQPPLGLLDALEKAGCCVVNDDLLLGWRWFFDDVPETDNPWRSLAESYLERSVPSSLRHPIPHFFTDALVDKVHRSGAEAVIFLPGKFCGPDFFDHDAFRTALERARIASLEVRVDEKMNLDQIRKAVKIFVSNLSG